jgi:hypothetical protein
LETLVTADVNGQVGTKSLSYRLSACWRKPTQLWAVSCSSVYVLRAESCLGICGRSTPSFLYASKRCSSRSDHRFCLFVLERPCSALQESPLLLLKSGDKAAPTPIKQSAAPPVQEQSAPVRDRFLNFVEQRTRIVPSLRPGRAAKMYSHERPSFHIRSSFASSSSVHGTLLFFGFNGA